MILRMANTVYEMLAYILVSDCLITCSVIFGQASKSVKANLIYVMIVWMFLDVQEMACLQSCLITF